MSTTPRSRFRFSLRTLLILVTLAAVLAFWYRVRSERLSFEQELSEKLNAHVKTARDAYGAVQASFDAQTATIFALLEAQRALAEAEAALADAPEEEVAALQKIVTRLQTMEKLITQLYDAGSMGGEASAYWSVKRERETAEITLLKAQYRAGMPRSP